MENLSLLIDLHRRQLRQGPGSSQITARAMEIAGLRDAGVLRIADIGCGTGAASLQLAALPDVQVTAFDLLPEFIDELTTAAERLGVAQKIQAMVGSMDQLPFVDGEFDVLWSEGAIYILGFEEGIRQWRRLLKPGGLLVASEITWLTDDRPTEVQEYWQSAYPGIATQAEKTAQLEASGYTLVDAFALPESCWMENYYLPLQESFEDFLARHPGEADAAALVAAEEEEIALYTRYKDYYSYCMYIARVAS